jgi:hypothetical protein
MSELSVYRQFAERFSSAPLQKLVESFNREVGQYAWHYSRSLHDLALMDEFRRRGIDVSAVDDGKAISFAHHVSFDESEKRLVTID